ncbi:MAG: pyridoxal phosphate-dependent aminotransferase [Bacteroidota bacterium]
MQFSQLIASLEESATLALSKKVRELKAAGKDVIGLTLGEPDFDTPAHIVAAAKQALDEGYTHYPPVAGYPELREAIAAKLKRDNALDYSSKQIVVSTGAKQSLYNVVLSLLNPGDEAILPAPYWVSYHAMLHLGQADIKVVQTTIEADYKISPAQLEASLTDKTKLFFLTTPSNPTGSMYSQGELAALVEVLERYPNCYIISDEIYEFITFGQAHISLGTFDSIFERVITVNGFSKGYAMTGWRLGYIAAAPEVAAVAEKMQGQCTSGANAFAQRGAIAALNSPLDATFAMRDSFHQRRDMMHQALSAIPDVQVNMPDGAFYFYPDLSRFLGRKSPDGQVIDNINTLCNYMIDSVGLALVPGTAFGTAEHVRISYAYSEAQLQDALRRFEKGLLALTKS